MRLFEREEFSLFAGNRVGIHPPKQPFDFDEIFIVFLYNLVFHNRQFPRRQVQIIVSDNIL